jgi:hypothetical protein
MALTAGFGLGPVVAGLVAQWAPAPLVSAYLPHLVVALAVLVPLWRAPETVADAGPETGSLWSRMRVRSAADPRFRRQVAPVAPWVFGVATVAIAVLPGLVREATPGWTVAFSALVAGLTLGTGVAVQPLARRLAAADPGRAVAAGLTAAVLGLLAAAGVAALLLGGAYGLCLVAGLVQTQRTAPPRELAG